MITKKQEENKRIHFCENCNFKCSYKSEFDRHLNTAKHMKITNGNAINKKNKKHFCDCGKKFNFSSGLSRHKYKCTWNNNVVVQENHEEKPSLMEIITQNKEIMDALVLQNEQLMKKNTELTYTIIEQSNTIKEIVPKIGNNNTTNNNQFNLHVFLNEDCKDALNFSDFIDNIQISFEDLEHQSQVGFINGISKLFIENLQDLGTYKRPIHCTDKKRKTLYIKENNIWDKECSQETLKKGINKLSIKEQTKLIQEKEENQEEYENIESEFSEKCIAIQRNLYPDVPRDTAINKIIENISKKSGIIE